jgi:hypothetical protein
MARVHSGGKCLAFASVPCNRTNPQRWPYGKSNLKGDVALGRRPQRGDAYTPAYGLRRLGIPRQVARLRTVWP